MTALGALYAAERQDGVNALTVTLALLAAVATYIAAILAFGKDFPQPFFWLVAPWPVWAGVSVQLMILALQATRAKSIFILEGQLVQGAGLSKIEHKNIGYVAGEEAMNARLQSIALRLNNIFAYVLEFAAVVVFTIYCRNQFVVYTRPWLFEWLPVVFAALWLLVVMLTSLHIRNLFKTAYDYRKTLIEDYVAATP
jgi:hypothetical protein